MLNGFETEMKAHQQINTIGCLFMFFAALNNLSFIIDLFKNPIGRAFRHFEVSDGLLRVLPIHEAKPINAQYRISGADPLGGHRGHAFNTGWDTKIRNLLFGLF